MVSSLSIIFMFSTMIIALLLPILLVVVFYRRIRISIPAVLIGALIFFVSQILIRINMLKLMSGMEWYKSMAANTLLIGLFLGLTAGLFEEFGRFIGFRFMLKKDLQWKNGIAYGLGHGGIESIMLVGLTYINNIIYSFLINSGAFDKIIAPALPGEVAKQIKNAIVSASPAMFAFAGIERVMAIVVQIALSLVVLYAVMNRKYIYLLYAVLLHTLLDAPLPLLGKAGIWAAELYLFVWFVVSMVFIVKSKAIFRVNHSGEIDEVTSSASHAKGI